MKTTKFYKIKFDVLEEKGVLFELEETVEETTPKKAENHLRIKYEGYVCIKQIIEL